MSQERKRLLEYLDRLGAETEGPFIEEDKNRELRYFGGFVYRFEKMLRALPPLPAGSSILDIGVTPFTFFLASEFPESRIFGLDLTDRLRQRAGRNGVQLFACDLDEAKFPFEDEAFDLVIFAEVLEHIFAPPDQILGEVRRILRPGGTLLLSVPNIAKLSNRLGLLLGRQILQDPCSAFKRGVHGHGHIHEFTRRETIALCRRSGFAFEAQSMIGPTPRDVWKHGRQRLLRSLYHVATELLPPLRTTIMVRCTRPGGSAQ